MLQEHEKRLPPTQNDVEMKLQERRKKSHGLFKLKIAQRTLTLHFSVFLDPTEWPAVPHHNLC